MWKTPLSIRHRNVIPILAGANLSAFKKDGVIRPITVGETLRRLPANSASKKLSTRYADFLAPLNLGFTVPSGAEAAAPAARSFLSNANPSDMFLKLDFGNAFNFFLPLSDIMDLRHQSSAMCIIMLGGKDIHPWSTTKVGNPIPPTITNVVGLSLGANPDNSVMLNDAWLTGKN